MRNYFDYEGNLILNINQLLSFIFQKKETFREKNKMSSFAVRPRTCRPTFLQDSPFAKFLLDFNRNTRYCVKTTPPRKKTVKCLCMTLLLIINLNNQKTLDLVSFYAILY